MSAMRTQKLPAHWRPSGRTMSASAQMPYTTHLFWRWRRSFIGFSSGAVRDAFAEPPRRAQREHGDQHDEREDIGVVAAQHAAREFADVARAVRFDEAQQIPADHRARKVADTSE